MPDKLSNVRDYQDLAKLASDLGYGTGGFEQLIIVKNGTKHGSATSLFEFFDDNPGAIDAVVEWMRKNYDFSDYEDEIDDLDDLDVRYPGAFEALVKEYESQKNIHTREEFELYYKTTPEKFSAREFAETCQFVEIVSHGETKLISRLPDADTRCDACEDITWDDVSKTWEM